MSMKPYITPERRQNIADDLKAGESWNTISQRYDVSYSTIRRIKKTIEGGSETMTEDKKIPETALSGETVSEITDDTAFSGIDNDIIPEVPEVVKPEKYSPYESAVDDAVLERIERLRDKIADLQLEMSNYESEISRLEEYHLKYMEVLNNANG